MTAEQELRHLSNLLSLAADTLAENRMLRLEIARLRKEQAETLDSRMASVAHGSRQALSLGFALLGDRDSALETLGIRKQG